MIVHYWKVVYENCTFHQIRIDSFIKTKDTSMPQILAADFFTIIESEKAKKRYFETYNQTAKSTIFEQFNK